VKRRDLVVGATIGLASGLFVDYFVLLGVWLLQLPSSGGDPHQLVASPFFLLVALVGAALGANYYSSES
jgi:hypothetical protein